MSCCSSSTRLTTCDEGSAFRVPSASRSAKFSNMDCAGRRSPGISVPYFFLNSVRIEVQSHGSRVTGTPWALATASVCSLVSYIISAVFHAVTTRANSRLCGTPPDVKSNPRSDAPSLSEHVNEGVVVRDGVDTERVDDALICRTVPQEMLKRKL